MLASHLRFSMLFFWDAGGVSFFEEGGETSPFLNRTPFEALAGFGVLRPCDRPSAW